MAQWPIEDHGLVGDLHTTALVALDGTIDFFCVPRFDSPSVFASLLGEEKGGHFAFGPAGDTRARIPGPSGQADLAPTIRAIASWDFPPLNGRRRTIR